MSIASWWAGLKRRQRAIDRVLMALNAAGLANDYECRKSGHECHLCSERTYAITPLVRKTSLSGEKFCFSGRPVAHMCARCETIGLYSDSSGSQTHVDEWQPTSWIEEAKAATFR